MTSTAQIPVGQPLHGASFGESVKRFLRGYVKFSGRASRSEFWWAMLFTTIVSLLASIPYWIAFGGIMARAVEARGSATPDDAALAQELAGLTGGMFLGLGLLGVVSLAFVLPTFAVMWRRLQDANFHGAFSLLNLVGFGIVPLVMCFLPSNPAGAQYDPERHAQLGLGYPASGQQPHTYAQPYGQQVYGQAPQPYGGQADGSQQRLGYGGPAYGGQAYGGPAYGGPPHDGQQPQA